MKDIYKGEVMVALQGLGWLQYQIVRARMAGVPKHVQLSALSISKRQYRRELQEARGWISLRLRAILYDLKGFYLPLETAQKIKNEFQTMAKVKSLDKYRTKNRRG